MQSDNIAYAVGQSFVRKETKGKEKFVFFT